MNFSGPGEKFLRVVVIKEIKGSQYGVQLESAVRDRLAADDKYEEEEEEALEKVVEFFQSKYFKKDSVITYHFPATSPTAEVIQYTFLHKHMYAIKVLRILMIHWMLSCVVLDCVYNRGKRRVKTESRECKCGGDDQEMVFGWDQRRFSFNHCFIGQQALC